MADAETLRLLALQSLRRKVDEPEEGEARAIRDEPQQQPAVTAVDSRRVQQRDAAAAPPTGAPPAVVPSFAAAARPAGSGQHSFIITFDDDDVGFAPPPAQAPAPKPATALPPAKLQSEIVRMRNAIAMQERARLAAAPRAAGNGVAQPAKKVPKGIAAVKPSPKKLKTAAAPAPAAKPPPFSVRAPAAADTAAGMPRDKTALLTAAATADDFLKAMAAGVPSGAAPAPAHGSPAAKPPLIPMKRASPAAAPAHGDVDKRPRTSADPPQAKSVGAKPLVVPLKPRVPLQSPPPVPPPAGPASGPFLTAPPAADDAADAALAQRLVVLHMQRLGPDELRLAQHVFDEAVIAEQRLLVRQSLASGATPELLTQLAEAAARRAAAQARVAAAHAALASPSFLALHHGDGVLPADALLHHAAPALPATSFQGETSVLVEEFRLKRRAELRNLAMSCAPSLAQQHAATAPVTAAAPGATVHGTQHKSAELRAAREHERAAQEPERRQRPEEQQMRKRDQDGGARVPESAGPRGKSAGKRQNVARSPGAVTRAAKRPQQPRQPTPSRTRSAPAAKAPAEPVGINSDTTRAALSSGASAAAAVPAHPPLLFAAASVTAVLENCAAVSGLAALDSRPMVTALSSAGDYESPLLALRSVRGLPQFTGAWRLDTSCPTFSHAIDPTWPLCPFDLRGECRDAACPWQSKDDTAISASELISDLEALGVVPALSASGTSLGMPGQLVLAPVQEPRKQRRPTRPPVAELLVPTFVRAHGAVGPARATVFRTGLLAPAAAFAALPAAADDAAEDRTPAADARVGRYHSTEENAVQRASVVESQVLEDPTDVSSWLHLGLSKIGFSFDNAANASADDALTVLARGLEANSSSVPMWVAYLRIFSRRFTLAESRDMAEHALKYVSASPVLWRMVVSLHDEPQSAAVVARRAVVALSAAVNAAPPGPGAVAACAAALDGGLNALSAACDFDNAEELAAWAVALQATALKTAAAHTVTTTQPSVLDAVACLVHVLSTVQAAVLLSAAAEALATRRLPLITSAAAGCQHPDVLPAIRWPSSSAAANGDDLPLRLLRMAFKLCCRGSAHAAATAAENYLFALAARQGAAAALAALPELQAALPSGAPLAPLLRCSFALVGAVEGRDAALERAKVLLKTAPDDADLSEARIDFLAVLARTQGLEEATALAERWMLARGSAPDTAWSLLISACAAFGGKDLTATVSTFERALDLLQPAAELADESLAAARERVFLEYIAFVVQCVTRGRMQPSALCSLLARRAREAVATLPALVERFDSLRDTRVRALLEPRAPSYTAVLAGAAAAALRSLPLDVLADVAEAAVDASPGAVPVALEAARRACAAQPVQAQRAAVAWATPLLAATLVAAVPSPPPHIWAVAIQLCSDSPDAAHELACVALQQHPRCRSLRRVMQLCAALFRSY